MSILEQSKEKERVVTIRSRALEMFGPLYAPGPSELGDTKSMDMTDLMLNKCLRAIIVHNYRNKINMDNIASRDIKVAISAVIQDILPSNATSQKKAYSQSEIVKIFNSTLIEHFTGCSIGKFTLMKLLMLLLNFFIECEGTMEYHLKCTKNIKSDNKIGDKLKLNSKRDKEKFSYSFYDELKKHGLEEEISKMVEKVNKIFESKENGTANLTKSEITAIRLFTVEKVNQVVKKCYFAGNSCEFRNFSLELRRGLTKVKRYDETQYINSLGFENDTYVYCGLRNIHFNPEEDKSTMKKLMESSNDSNNENHINGFMFHSYTSTSTDPVTSFTTFCQQYPDDLIGGGVMIEIPYKELHRDPRTLFGDISWISEYEAEKEVLIGPCILNFHRTDIPDTLDKYKHKFGELYDNDKSKHVMVRATISARENIKYILDIIKTNLTNRKTFSIDQNNATLNVTVSNWKQWSNKELHEYFVNDLKGNRNDATEIQNFMKDVTEATDGMNTEIIELLKKNEKQKKLFFESLKEKGHNATLLFILKQSIWALK